MNLDNIESELNSADKNRLIEIGKQFGLPRSQLNFSQVKLKELVSNIYKGTVNVDVERDQLILDLRFLISSAKFVSGIF